VPAPRKNIRRENLFTETSNAGLNILRPLSNADGIPACRDFFRNALRNQGLGSLYRLGICAYTAH
jgi:hypothetical protein